MLSFGVCIGVLRVFLHFFGCWLGELSQSTYKEVDHCVYGSGRNIPPSQPPCELLANGRGLLAGARASAFSRLTTGVRLYFAQAL